MAKKQLYRLLDRDGNEVSTVYATAQHQHIPSETVLFGVSEKRATTDLHIDRQYYIANHGAMVLVRRVNACPTCGKASTSDGHIYQRH